ncbi:hypothetical protein CF326_g7495 [Tilletia indica]|nr:hypothetical protein CF326_g7495 [Tilletia indica]
MPGSGSGAAGAPTSPSSRCSAWREGVSMVESPSQEREVLLDDAGAGAGSPLVSVAVTAGGVPIRLGSSAESDTSSRSSMENGNFTDADSIYPDDAASNCSRDTSHTDEDGLGSLQQQQQRAWNYTNALKKQDLSGVGSAGLGSDGPSGSGGLASTFPGDAPFAPHRVPSDDGKAPQRAGDQLFAELIHFLVAKDIFEGNPGFDQGDLTKLKSLLVQNTTLAALAERKGMKQFFGSASANLRPFMVDILVGAVALDSDFDMEVLERLYDRL